MRPRTLGCRTIRALGFSVAAAGLIAFGFSPRFALAHPMGNFSISHFSGIRVAPGSVEIHYLLDMAEIPTFQELQATGIVPDPHDARVTAYLAGKGEALKAELLVTLNGRPLALELVSDDAIFPAGAGGLTTMKIGFVYRARFAGDACGGAPCTLDYRDGNSPDRTGWKEIVVTAGEGAMLRSSTAPVSSRSQELANYPTDLINSPPQDLSARVAYAVVSVPGGASDRGNSSRHAVREAPVASKVSNTRHRAAVTQPAKSSPAPGQLALKSNAQGTPRNRFTELIASNQWGLWFLLTAALIAAALGGLHALEPGHGKTIVAAYLVGSQGTAAHALWLGLIVTVTHTAGVYALGLITLYASKYIVPDRLYPWLGVASGLTIALLGLYMLRRRLAGYTHGHSHGHDGHHHHHRWFGHSHTHDHAHRHHAHAGHDHGHADDHQQEHDHRDHHQHRHEHAHPHQHAQEPSKSVSYRQLIALGVTGGIVPCPAALVVLLSAVSLHRVAFGLYLILAFSLGLAAVLISIGLVTVYARRLLARVPADGPIVTRWLPMASAAVITCLGLALVFQGLLSMGVVHVQV